MSCLFAPASGDAIVLRSVALTYSLPSPFSSPSAPATHPQQLLLSARLFPVSGGFSAAFDVLDDSTISYAVVADAFSEHLKAERGYQRAEQIAEGLAQVALWDCGAQEVDLEVELPSALLLAGAASVVLTRRRQDYRFLSQLVPRQILLRGTASSEEDRLVIKGLEVACVIGVFDFEREERQKVVGDLVCWPVRQAGEDWLASTRGSDSDMGIGMKRLARAVTDHLTSTAFQTLEALATSTASLVLNLPSSSSYAHPSSASAPFAIHQLTLTLSKPSAVAFAAASGVQITRKRGRWMNLLEGDIPPAVGMVRAISPVKGFSTSAAPTPLQTPRPKLPSSDPQPGSASVNGVINTDFAVLVEPEGIIVDGPPISSVANPPAGALAVGVEDSITTLEEEDANHTVYLSLGSNLGDRMGNLAAALAELAKPLAEGGAAADPKAMETSFVYESDPMYVVDQPQFLNAVSKVVTSLPPLRLLNTLQEIETKLGRVKTIDKGPRTIDLDILMFDDRIISHDRLKVPHVAMTEREFVLRPLADIAPGLRHPSRNETILSLFFAANSSQSSTVHRVAYIPPIPSQKSPSLDFSARTHLMSIVNCTPDSFSDGGDAFNPDAAVAAALAHIDEGADILDVGGMSTRPGADGVDEQEEIHRTVPVIRALREKGVTAHISIDTFRSLVARAAVEAGATMINDVTGGAGDEQMLDTMAELNLPVVLMHMRGEPQTMTGLAQYDGGDVVAGVRRELSLRVSNALKAGVKRWNIIVDPGIGFAKNLEGNCTLLRDLSALTQLPLIDSEVPAVSLAGFPVLVGPSRKSFLGKLTEWKGKVPEPKDRVFATAATCVAAVAGGARIVRVHDTKAMRETVRVADAIYRPKRSME